MKQARLNISGRVQGVWFRGAAKDEAKKLGLVGYAKNVDDGSVEILIQGEEGAIRKFIEWCRQGPEIAQVDNVDVRWKEPDLSKLEFEVR
ncbi:acylphosphatase [Patescibacteria group bacterium]|nr:acylphosphatase [Patescibacteria group bacterium]